MQDLNITLVQTNISWENPTANRNHYEQQLAALDQPTNLIILPEMFTTGFTMNAVPHAETMDGPSVSWMKEQAAKHKAVVTGSLIIKENGKHYNRLIWMRPDGTYATYDKRHRFAMAGEHEHYEAGTERLVVELNGWRICPLICYDLRFPVWARNRGDYDLLIYTANWPDKRAYDWNTLLRARAIENQCYVAAVNRVGQDANGFAYNGDSCVIDPGWRHTLWRRDKVEAVKTITLSADHLLEVRRRLPFLVDGDAFKIS